MKYQQLRTTWKDGFAKSNYVRLALWPKPLRLCGDFDNEREGK